MCVLVFEIILDIISDNKQTKKADPIEAEENIYSKKS